MKHMQRKTTFDYTRTYNKLDLTLYHHTERNLKWRIQNVVLFVNKKSMDWTRQELKTMFTELNKEQCLTKTLDKRVIKKNIVDQSHSIFF